MQVQTGLELANHEIIVGISLDALNGETTDPRVDLAGQHVGLGVASLEVERLLTVESEDLGRGHHVTAAEDSKAGVLVRNVGGLLPGKVDGVVDNVVNGEVTDTENRGKGSAAESTATGDGLVLVEGEGQILAEELADGVLDSGHTGAATDHLNEVNILDLELGLGKSLLKGNGNPVQKGLDHLLELLTLQHSANIGVFHQRLDAHRSLRVGRQHLLKLLSRGEGTGPGLGVGADVDLELLLELIGQVLGQGNVEITATKVTVIGGGLHIELTLAELNNGSGVVGVTNVNEDHAAGLLLRARQVELGDTVTERGGGGVVDKAQSIEAGNISGIDHGTALHIGEPSGNADSDVGNWQPELLGGDILDLGKVHGHQLGCGELLLLALVADLDTSLSIDVTEEGTVELLLDRDIGVVEGAADEALQGADGVLQVGGLLCLGAFANVSAAGAESDQGPMYKIFESAFRNPNPSDVGQH